MTTKERILALRLLEKQEQYSDYARKIGIQVKIIQLEDKNV